MKLNLAIFSSIFFLPAAFAQSDLPKVVDWREKGYVTPVKDQGQCGASYAFAAISALEGAHFSKTGKLVSLSEQQIIDCSGPNGNNGCGGGGGVPSADTKMNDGGEPDQVFAYIKMNGGVQDEASYPYTAEDGDCNFSKNNIAATLTGFVDIPSMSEEDLQRAIAKVGPIAAGIDASLASFQDYTGGIYHDTSCSTTMLDHHVTIVGYNLEDEANPYYIIKNSWGTGWGESGYMKMAANKNTCGIATEASYPTFLSF
ncbi:unnamed protein product [Cunninghamella echinulata]